MCIYLVCHECSSNAHLIEWITEHKKVHMVFIARQFLKKSTNHYYKNKTTMFHLLYENKSQNQLIQSKHTTDL